jgi:sodium/potassium-transporting ATPase subunit alpha
MKVHVAYGPNEGTINNGIHSHQQRDSVVGRSTTVNSTRLKEDVHIIPLDDLYKRFHTDPRQGLSSSLVVDSQARYGTNKLTPPKPSNFLSLLVKELFIGFNIILWIARILAFLAYKPFGDPTPSIANLALGVILFLVIICNSLLSVYQNIKSTKIVSTFSKLLPAIVTVRREGREEHIMADQIVPGDIILIRIGDKLPADCRFLVCDGLRVNISLFNRTLF